MSRDRDRIIELEFRDQPSGAIVAYLAAVLLLLVGGLVLEVCL